MLIHAMASMAVCSVIIMVALLMQLVLKVGCMAKLQQIWPCHASSAVIEIELQSSKEQIIAC